MLHTQTVEPGAFSVLKQLMEIPALKEFALVGGTAISFIYGHLKSVDLDLFSHAPFDNETIISCLEREFTSQFKREQKPQWFGVFCYINDIRVDMIRHPHPSIAPVKTLEGIRLFSTEDIIAMNVQAILGRGRKKDFWDIAELLHHYTVVDFINFHERKYAGQNLLISVPQAITYFADAEEDEDPVSLKNQSWEKIKSFIGNKVSEYLR